MVNLKHKKEEVMYMKMKAYFNMIEGTNYEAGYKLGRIYSSQEGFSLKEDFIDETEARSMLKLFDDFCPGINEEIEGFADALNINKTKVIYYAMTYLRPGCSQFALLPSKTSMGHTVLARNYDFSPEAEEMRLVSTRIKGRYAHIGASIVQFGRGDGMNEHGLAISQSSAGLPVGNFEFAAKPAIKGLQFWAVIRSVLENCKDVEEVIKWTRDMPIAYNINMIAADKNGNAVLLESYNGEKAYKKIDSSTKEQHIASTNHVHLESLNKNVKVGMANSIVRYNLINSTIESTSKMSMEDIKRVLSVKYPEGLCCHCYDDFFGTLRSMILDSTDKTMHVCFGSPDTNSWYDFKFDDDKVQDEYYVILHKEKTPAGFFDMISSI